MVMIFFSVCFHQLCIHSYLPRDKKLSYCAIHTRRYFFSSLRIHICLLASMFVWRDYRQIIKIIVIINETNKYTKKKNNRKIIKNNKINVYYRTIWNSIHLRTFMLTLVEFNVKLCFVSCVYQKEKNRPNHLKIYICWWWDGVFCHTFETRLVFPSYIWAHFGLIQTGSFFSSCCG